MQLRKLIIPVIIVTVGCSGSPEGRCTETVAQDDSIFSEEEGTLAMESCEPLNPDVYFSIAEISDSIFQTMDGVSYSKGAPVRLSDLREVRVLHYDFEGDVRAGLIICHKAVAKDMLEIFRELYDIGYQIESILPVDNFGGDDNESMKANNTSCFNYRSTPGGSRLSYHAYGTAIDINPLYNPYVRKTRSGTIVLPEEGKRYADRSVRQTGMIQPGDECVAIFKKHGFTWGGDWRRSTRDYQHFEKRLKR